MAKKDKYAGLNRIIKIVNKLNSGIAFSFEEFLNSLENEDEKCSIRTFQRDLIFIDDEFGLKGGCEKKTGLYKLLNKEEDYLTKEKLKALSYYNALRLDTNLQEIIFPNIKQTDGYHYISPIIKAIKAEKQITFTYSPFWSDSQYEVIVSPYGLKEFESRWYLVALDHKENKIKNYALDRIKFEIIQLTEKRIGKIDIKSRFENVYGIIKSDTEPHEVILQFTSFQGQYIKSQPLHHSQQIIEDTDKYLTIKLYLHCEFEFKQKILSLGNTVKVLSPICLIDEIKAELLETLNQY